MALHKPEPKAKGKREEQEKTVETTKDSLAPVSGERARVRGPDPELTEQTVLRMKLLGANPNPQVVGLEELPGLTLFTWPRPAVESTKALTVAINGWRSTVGYLKQG